MYKKVTTITDNFLISMSKSKVTPMLGIAFFAIVGIFAAIWVWASMILS